MRGLEDHMEFINSIPVWGWGLIAIGVVGIGYLKIQILKKMMNK